MSLLVLECDTKNFDTIRNGAQKISILVGDCKVRKGPVAFDFRDGRTLPAILTTVELKSLSQVTDEEFEAEGYIARTDFLSQMSTRYPGISLDTSVSIIHFELYTGPSTGLLGHISMTC